MKIIKTEEQKCLYEYETMEDHFIVDKMLRVRRFTNSIRITDISNALKIGKTCKEISINVAYDKHFYDVDNFFRDLFIGKYSISKIFNLFNEDSELGNVGYVYVSDKKSNNTFSPLQENIKNVKPLKELPKKWTMRHVVKALINNQCEDLKMNYKYSDDYAYDASMNYFEGVKLNNLVFAQDLIEESSGWWTSINEDNTVKVCCHTFESNSFKLKLT